MSPSLEVYVHANHHHKSTPSNEERSLNLLWVKKKIHFFHFKRTSKNLFYNQNDLPGPGRGSGVEGDSWNDGWGGLGVTATRRVCPCRSRSGLRNDRFWKGSDTIWGNRSRYRIDVDGVLTCVYRRVLYIDRICLILSLLWSCFANSSTESYPWSLGASFADLGIGLLFSLVTPPTCLDILLKRWRLQDWRSKLFQ